MICSVHTGTGVARICGQHRYSQSMELAGFFWVYKHSSGMACAVEQYGSTAVDCHAAVYTDLAIIT